MNLFDFIKVKPKNNPKDKTFDKISDTSQEELDKNSSIDNFYDKVDQHGPLMNVQSVSGVNKLFIAIPTDKPTRLGQYRNMSQYPEVNQAVCEICENAATINEESECVFIDYSKDLKKKQQETISEAYEEYITLFDFENNMFEYMFKFIVNGEMVWENIIDDKDKSAGVVGIKEIKPESFEYAIDLQTGEKRGLAILVDPRMLNYEQYQNNTQNYGVDISQLNCYVDIKENKVLFLPWSQITYIDTGEYTSDGLIPKPVLEAARKPYNQLTLIEDAIIIHRLVRAPERLVFNVDTGKMNPAKAQQEVRRMMQQYSQKQVYNPQTGTIANGYDVHNMLESYWFAKSSDGEGTTVETLAGSDNWSEIPELDFFVKKLYISLKVPFSRYSDPTIQIERNESIDYEEFKFYRFIMRLLYRFSKGLDKGFETHLKLKGLWDQFKLTDDSYQINFVPPAQYEIYEAQRAFQAKIESYTAFKDAMEGMDSFAAKKYFNFSDEEMEKMYESRKLDVIRTGELELLASKASEGELTVEGDKIKEIKPEPEENPEDDEYEKEQEQDNEAEQERETNTEKEEDETSY